MPLPAPGKRELIHRREIVCEGYRREDGLWEMEGRLVDTKTYDFGNRARGTVPAGEPVHLMCLRVALDNTLTVREVTVVSDFHPYPACGEITPAYESLVGLQVRPGLSQQLRERFGGAGGCVHITRLMENLVQTALQTMGPLLGMEESLAPGRKPPHLGGCYALSLDGQVVKEHYPDWYRPRD